MVSLHPDANNMGGEMGGGRSEEAMTKPYRSQMSTAGSGPLARGLEEIDRANPKRHGQARSPGRLPVDDVAGGLPIGQEPRKVPLCADAERVARDDPQYVGIGARKVSP